MTARFLHAVLLIALACGGRAADADPLLVFVSIPPQKYLAERIGGTHVRVETLVPPGASAETYDPGPRQIARLAAAKLYFAVGVPFERVWLPRIAAAHPSLRIVETQKGIPLRHWEGREQAAGHHAGESAHEHPGDDFHVWTAPALAAVLADRMHAALTEIDPAHAADYARGHAALADELQALDSELRSRLANLASRRFLTVHPAWGYFADAYGLEQIAIEHEGKEPGARALAALVEQARQDGIRAVFVQPQFSRRSAEAIAEAIDAEVLVIDDLAEDYPANLRRVAEALAKSLEGGT